MVLIFCGWNKAGLFDRLQLDDVMSKAQKLFIMRGKQQRASLGKILQGCADIVRGLGVKCGRRLIEQYKIALLIKSAGKPQPLALPLRKILSAFAKSGHKTLGKFLCPVKQSGFLQGFGDVFLLLVQRKGRIKSQADIFGQRRIEEMRLLWYIRKFRDFPARQVQAA